jgi:hypothetical protein
MRLTKLSQQPESSRDEMIEKQKNIIEALVVRGNRELWEKNRVSFSPRVHIKRYLSRTDMKREEVEACWFSIEEFHAIQASCAKEIIRGARRPPYYYHTDNGDKTSIRGLETFFPIAQIVKERNRFTAMRAVLDTQEHNRDDERFYNYEEAIWRAYHQASSGSTLWARRCGLVDKNEADAIYDDLENNYIKRTECSSLDNTMVVGSSTTPSPTARTAKAA